MYLQVASELYLCLYRIFIIILWRFSHFFVDVFYIRLIFVIISICSLSLRLFYICQCGFCYSASRPLVIFIYNSWFPSWSFHSHTMMSSVGRAFMYAVR